MDITAPSIDVLIVASTRRWMADDLAAADVVPVVFDHGLDAPLLPEQMRPAWWTPTGHAARLHASGVPFSAAAPGPAWLSSVPAELTGRPIWSGRLVDIDDAPRSGWCKAAEMKLEQLPATWWDDTTAFAAAAAAAGALPESWVQVSPVRMELTQEHRVVVHNGQITTSSWYLTGQGTWDLDARPDVDDASAAAFATDVVAALGTGQPGAYTLDVAQRADGAWCVLEGNPVWSSAPYGTDPVAFTRAVLAAFTDPGRWQWQPDPLLSARAARRPLPRSRPLWLNPDGTLRPHRA